MNMKRMMTAATAMIAGTLMADVSVEDIKCTQRYPWNGLVDIEYMAMRLGNAILCRAHL